MLMGNLNILLSPDGRGDVKMMDDALLLF